ncbi:hypothetical protein [Psychrobacter namhaensis]|uniref:hypothetical protein n=1 Tax=Psychrobacter namhaensis TaxID=292734 RepID=UPI00103D5E38|nr:hypothetical protein [Psychrobacter namhaensis]
MYDNPKHIKDQRINARFNDDEIEAINSVASLTGLQKSTLVRQATLRFIEELKAELKGEFDRDFTNIKDAG